jgi:4-hydroxybenzoate polyprenyltransferase
LTTIAKGLVRATRPKQWSKNLLLFLSWIFALKLSDVSLFLLATAGFAVFCAASSAVYLVNDLVDIEKDRQHPTKRKRPLAAGLIQPWHAIVLAVVLTVGSTAWAFYLGTRFGAVTVGYLVLSFAYSFLLKHLVLIDVFTLAAGFVIRAAAGAVVIAVPISPWLYVCTALASLFVGFAKRRNELMTLEADAANHRRILAEYTPQLLDQLIIIVTSATVMAYSLYTFSAENLPRNSAMMLTIPFVLYGLFRYMYIVYVRNEGGSPEEVLLRDVPFLLNVVLWLATAVVVMYYFRQ